MPQIPIIGTPGPLPIPGAPTPDQSGTRALDQAGDMLMSEAYRAQRERDAVAQQQAAAEAHVATINAGSDIQQQTLDAFNDRYSSGQIAGAADAALSTFDQATADARKTIPDIGQTAFDAHTASMRATLKTSLAEKEMGGRNIQLGADTSDGIDSDAKLAMTDPSQAGALISQRQSSIDLLPIPPEERAKLHEKAGQTIAFAAGSTMMQKNPQGFLDSLTPDAVQKDPILSSLSPTNLESLRNGATTLVQQQANAAQRAKDQAEATAQKTYNQGIDLFHQGQGFDLGFQTQLRQDTMGTSLAGQAQALITASTKVAGFGSQSLPQQQASLQALESQFSKAGTNPDDAQMLSSLRTIASNQQSAFKDDPLSAYTQFAKGPAMPPQQVNSVQDGLQLVASRLPALTGVEAYGGSQGVSPLHPQEAEQLGAAIRKLPPDQAASALASLGTQITDPNRQAALAKQLGDKDGILGLAMAYAGDQTNSGRLVSELILRGDQALKDRASSQDQTVQSGWRATIADSIRGAYPTQQQENAAIEAALRIRATADTQGNIGVPDIETAVKLATGGVISHGAGKTVLPYGMTEDQFNAKLGAVTEQTLQAQAPDSMLVAGRQMIPLSVFAEHLPQATLSAVGGGRYAVRSGNSIVTNTAGDPVIVNVK